ncbi:tellurite resistance/C4-dicarboxylate transporter family protein [Nocardioides sp. YIM 152315]|uniref:tellurite resistance/C4-dicarboxylate transporter family protein n=1 Tax=Nocardioides sp. YIM 152315 TaxID=3031760 RepID=UPI0023DB67D1|nr:tellurite resistance/C4-dicarboxylate transporter family protein [Nocardioides sp. YIM 152315]MDF1604874.1 tellurite resistance/C4-dicarboxylate transporter family protein [Nocardioides sp. YIM 152315]
MSVLRDRLRSGVEGLTPGYFALVMASGILSVGMALQGHRTLSSVLLAICVTAFVVLLSLTAWRFVAFRHAAVDDFVDPRRGFGYFTFVAGTNVLGVRLGLDGHYTATAVLLALAGTAWLVLGYVVPWTAVLGRQERPVVATANGTWFIWTVGTQSVATAAATLEPHVTTGRSALALLAVLAWSVGVFLYAATGVVVTLRLMLYDFGPEELNPPYWVAMGALAITVLAGARIVEMADTPMVAATRGLIAGLSVVCWAFATWLIPVLVAAGWWRHVVRRLPLRYEPTLWSMVFPLGMYAAGGIYLGEADSLPLVSDIAGAELWVAFTAGVIVFAAMLWHLGRWLTGRASPG